MYQKIILQQFCCLDLLISLALRCLPRRQCPVQVIPKHQMFKLSHSLRHTSLQTYCILLYLYESIKNEQEWRRSPVFWMTADSLVMAQHSLLPTRFWENTLKLYELPMIRSETVAFSRWQFSSTVNHSFGGGKGLHLKCSLMTFFFSKLSLPKTTKRIVHKYVRQSLRVDVRFLCKYH